MTDVFDKTLSQLEAEENDPQPTSGTPGPWRATRDREGTFTIRGTGAFAGRLIGRVFHEFDVAAILAAAPKGDSE